MAKKKTKKKVVKKETKPKISEKKADSIFDELREKKLDPLTISKSSVIVDEEKIRPAKDVAYAEAIMKAKRRGPWEAVTLIIDAWASKNPQEIKAFKFQVDDFKSGLHNKEYGLTKDSAHASGRSKDNHDRRIVAMIPQAVHNMIRAVFNEKELKMDREFYREFATRFPMFRIPEKL